MENPDPVPHPSAHTSINKYVIEFPCQSTWSARSPGSSTRALAENGPPAAPCGAIPYRRPVRCDISYPNSFAMASAALKARAAMVRVGLAVVMVGNTPLPTMKRLG